MNLKNRIITNLRDAIVMGEYKPGEHLTEVSLSRRFKVSRTPIREALNQLEKEGFVKIIPDIGAKVVNLSLKDALDIYDLLIVLEGAACRLASLRINDEQINKLEEFNFLFEKAIGNKNIDLIFQLNFNFHWLITEATKNAYLIEIRANFRRLVDRIARIFPLIPGQPGATLSEHRQIIDALKARNPGLAEFIMREHLENAKNHLVEYLNKIKERNGNTVDEILPFTN